TFLSIKCLPPPPASEGCRGSVVRVSGGGDFLHRRKSLEHSCHPPADFPPFFLEELQLTGDLVLLVALLLQLGDRLLGFLETHFHVFHLGFQLQVVLPEAAYELGGALDALFQQFQNFQFRGQGSLPQLPRSTAPSRSRSR